MRGTLNLPQQSGRRLICTAGRDQSLQRGCTCWGPVRPHNRTLVPRAASAAERPGGDGSTLPKLPPLRRIRSLAPAADADVNQPPIDVDQELWELLELCSIEELEELHGILFGEAAAVHCWGLLASVRCWLA